MFPWIQKGREKKTILCHRVLGFFFFFKALEQHEKTEVSWTKGKLMHNPLGVRSQLGFIFTHYIQKLKNFKPSKN